jgi:hypothetical protein
MVWKNQDHGPASKTAVFEISIPGYLGDIGFRVATWNAHPPTLDQPSSAEASMLP